MSNPTNTTTQNAEESGAFDQTGRIMVVSIIVLLVVIIFVVFLHLYAKWYWHRVSNDSNNINRRRRMDFTAGHRELSAGTELRHGLDSAFLKTIPVVVFSLQDFEDGLECSVCLSEVSQGEDTRLLPKCNHIFHVECIDMWFQSHSTCPICRNPVPNSNPTTTTPDLSQEMVRQNTIVEEHDRLDNGGGVSTEALSYPTNVLYWRNEVQVSTLASCLENEDVASSASSLVIATGRNANTGDGHLVIEIPRQIIEDEDQKSPVQKRMRSLKKLVSRDRKLNPSSPTTAADVEQPAGRSQT